MSKCMLTKCVLTKKKSERGREAEEAEHGIQNQKQEPHTKLWGTKDYARIKKSGPSMNIHEPYGSKMVNIIWADLGRCPPLDQTMMT